MTHAVIIADDLTGAADTAAGFAARGCSAAVSLDGSFPGSVVVAVDTDTRRAAQGDAAAVVRATVARARGSGAEFLYKKVDSVFRGNVAAELAAFACATPGTLCVFAPAFPGTGRTTRDGSQLVHGVPLADTGIWQSAGTSPPDVRAQLRQAGIRVADVRLADVRGTAAQLAARFAAEAGGNREAGADHQAPAVVVCDAETDADLAAIVAGVCHAGVRAVWAGSGGLAAQLPLPAGFSPGCRPERAAGADGRVVAVVGSAGLTARRQADQLQKAGLRHVPVSA